ncbi:MAG TPA: sensor histidine kinase [Opitutaceae bacterium]|nr:sensor histidine kinase [Opitutaceae bacterium]
MQSRWIKYALVVAGWLFLGFVLSVEIYFNLRAGMRTMPVDFAENAFPQFVRAAMWGLMAPWILRLRVKLPLRRGAWCGGVAFHLAMSFVVMAVFYLGRIFGYVVFWREPIGDFWWLALGGFYGRNLIDMAYYWAVLAFGYSLEIHRRYKSEELKAAQLETRLVETELKALREQLRPHFLFNTLNTIAVLVREQRNDEAVTLIARLSSLLRFSLDAARTPEVTLREEMQFLERYIDIQKARFSDRLTVGVEIEPAALDARIPNLLLQPLVENAILHGVAPKPGPGRVEISGRVESDRLHLEVRDDGPGIGSGHARVEEGVGLTNTRERIRKIYGAAGHLSLRSEPGRGVTVQIVLPCRI